MKEKIIKLLLSGGRDAQIANELIKAHNVDISGEDLGFKEIGIHTAFTEFYDNHTLDLWAKDKNDGAWYLIHSTAEENYDYGKKEK